MNEKPDHSHYILPPAPSPGPGAAGRSEPAAPAGRGLRALGVDPRRQGWAAHPQRPGLTSGPAASYAGTSEPGRRSARRGWASPGSSSSIRGFGCPRGLELAALRRREKEAPHSLKDTWRKFQDNREEQTGSEKALPFGQGPIKKGSVKAPLP